MIFRGKRRRPDTALHRTPSASPPSPVSFKRLGSLGGSVASIAIGIGLITICFSRIGAAEMSAADARRELLERKFTIVTKTREVPEPVRVLLAALTKTDGPVLAEPDAKYQETDSIAEPGLPWRRLIFAGNGKGIYFVNYELGGRGHSYHVAVFEWVPGRISLVWRAVLGKRLGNMAELREAIRAGRYKDDRSYGF